MQKTPNIGIIGSGDVARSLAAGFLKYRYPVMIGSRDPGKLADWAHSKAGIEVGDFQSTAAFGAVIVLSVKGSVAASALRLAGEENLLGKVVVDTTNPLADEPPQDGVLRFTTGPNNSAMEALQTAFPKARFVKAFNSVGSAHMVDPQFEGGPPSMFLCGNDLEAKTVVSKILVQFGWEPLDMGLANAARALEPLCMLWCLRGFRENQWNHAFKLLRHPA